MSETFGGSGTRNKTIVLHGTLKLKQQTNADRIRSMSDEELAEFMLSAASEYACYPEASSVDCERFAFDCKKCWFYWLKQEEKT